MFTFLGNWAVGNGWTQLLQLPNNYIRAKKVFEALKGRIKMKANAICKIILPYAIKRDIHLSDLAR